MNRATLFLLLFGVLLKAPVALACVGDCDGTNSVSAADIGLAVEIALGREEASACLMADGNGDLSVAIDDLLLAVLARQTGCPTATPTVRAATPTPTAMVQPVFPADYRSTFVEVRNCRFSIEHGGVSVRVLTDPTSAQAYLDEQNPLPVGAIVVKEEFDGPDCLETDLIRWRAMRKESPGFDPDDGDWHWQWVEPDRSVLFDDKATCIGCHIRPACVARDYMCTEEGDAATLREVLSDLPGALLSVSGTGPSNVYAVGTDPPQDQVGPLLFHYNGTSWQRLNPRATGDLWWVSVEPIEGSFYMAGDGGLVLRVDADNSVTRLETPTTALLAGVWGTAANDIWSVGSDDEGQGVVLHYDGDAFTVQDLSGVVTGGLPRMYKVWGRSSDEVYAVGERGTIIRYDGDSWTQMVSDTVRDLFTIHGDPSSVFAVGGFIDGAIVELTEGAFEDATPAGLPQMNGVFVPALGQPAAVGRELSMARRSASGWDLKQKEEGSLHDFHSTWIDPEGGVWAAGGELRTLEEGLLYYAGTRTISSVIEQPPRCPTAESGGGGTVSYANDVVPILQQNHCLDIGCHGGAFPSSGYDQRTHAASFKQGIEARVLDVCPIVPGDADASYLVEKLGATPRLGQRMPNTFPALSAEHIDTIRTWIIEGARNN